MEGIVEVGYGEYGEDDGEWVMVVVLVCGWLVWWGGNVYGVMVWVFLFVRYLWVLLVLSVKCVL